VVTSTKAKPQDAHHFYDRNVRLNVKCKILQE